MKIGPALDSCSLDRQARHQDDRHASLWTTHENEKLWEIVAFLQKLPDLTERQYNDWITPPERLQVGRPSMDKRRMMAMSTSTAT